MAKNAVLVGIHLPKVTADEVEGSLQELTRLVTTLGYNVVGTMIQKRNSDKFATVLGEGKLRDLAKWTGGSGKVAPSFEKKKTKAELKRLPEEVEEVEESTFEPTERAHVVIVDTDLSPSQLRNLESAVGVPVLDRTGVIIEIFSRHANTRAAKLQVEIAKLTYLAPRLRETGGGADRGGGGIGGKGSGESALELDKRRIRDRIKELKTELSSISNEHQTRRSRRQQEITVALVGYTNAGKSSLMRALTGSEVLVADKLFATLDTTIRPMYPETKPKVLVSDTVGFIKKLPHDLVASFKSTLDEAANASLLLFVVDSADPSFQSQLEVTEEVLKEVGAVEIPKLLIMNKMDKLDQNELNKLKSDFPEAIFISTRNKEDIKMLRDKILSYFEADMIEDDVFIPFEAKGIIGELRARMRVLSETYNEKGVTLRVRATSDALKSFQKKINRP